MKGLKVSENKRFLVYDDGQPFFYLGDTAWELIHRLSYEEMEKYFESRSKNGFNAIQTVLISEFDGLNIPNYYGELPLIDKDPSMPNEKYFNHVDKVLQLAQKYGLYLVMAPVWGDKIEKKGWGIGPEIFKEKEAEVYGRWLGKRYKDFSNIIWLNGGDRQGGNKNFPIWNALGNALKQEDPNHLMTFHPIGDASSGMWFHNSEWLDFNICQSGHSLRDYPNYVHIMYDYSRQPVKPCLDSEPRYEEHAINWKYHQYGAFDDYDIRQAAYWSVFAGACGHTYGAAPIWQMYCPRYEPLGFVTMTWEKALDLPGCKQMQHLKNLVLSRPYFSRIPDQNPIPSPKVGDEHIRCTRGDGYLFVYLPLGGEVEIDASSLSGNELIAWWFDPRTGNASKIGTYSNSNKMIFNAPGHGRKNDWVLVLDDASYKLGKPGEF